MYASVLAPNQFGYPFVQQVNYRRLSLSVFYKVIGKAKYIPQTWYYTM